MPNSLTDQTVVVIGGGAGIGAAVAALAQSQVARVVAISRSGGATAGVDPIAVDVCDRAALAMALERVGSIDHVVHTAGARFGSVPLERLDEDALSLAFDTKLFSALRAVRRALPHLSVNASITFTSDQLSRKYGVGTLVNGVVNAAVEAAGKHLAKELAPRRVNVITPGVVDTDVWGEPGSATRLTFLESVRASLPVCLPRVGTRWACHLKAASFPVDRTGSCRHQPIG